ncbi:uncharacterized protein LOC111311214 [Durio zibethinus]|uniref:Uncharacterized protein LOC111311214 n=1 Tax=Durio zibethinus TaxID=66656 RepID=A0A6P6AN89_DURZI|nr:uncharacterized protein LOC111311214 [Durio zibethinus]
MALHPPSLKQASITPLPLPLPSIHFSSQKTMLDPGKELPKSYVSSSDKIGRRLSDSYDSYDHAMKYESRVQKTAQNYANYRSCNSMEGSFGAETSMIEDESGFSTPPLWKTSPSRSPLDPQNINYRCLSPSSKAQAIARGQRELMEMVSRMPESCYELTLKDLVEHQPVDVVEPKKESLAEGRDVINEDAFKSEKGKKKKQNNPKPQINRSGSIDNGGFLLKMVLPISLGSKKKKKKKKKNDSNTNHNSKVSPKPTVSDASDKSVDKEWWKKRSGSSESESGGSTINSGSAKSCRSNSTSSSSSSCRSISDTSRRHRRGGCLAFILARKSKASR